MTWTTAVVIVLGTGKTVSENIKKERKTALEESTFGVFCGEIILFFVRCAGGRGWQWGGCSDNVEFGEKISKQYVDTQETGQDSRAAVNLHNNAAGRLVSPVHITRYLLGRIPR